MHVSWMQTVGTDKWYLSVHYKFHACQNICKVYIFLVSKHVYI